MALLLLLAVSPRGADAADAPAKTAPRPNVLFIAIDDLNDWVGFLDGNAQSKTPNLDRLARRAMAFTRAYCAAPACNPSRAALLTGIRPTSSGVYHNNQPWRPVMKDVVTLPQHFMAAGYRVTGGGKIFHGGFNDAASWQQYFRQPGDPRPAERPVNGIRPATHFDWGPVDVEDAAMGDAQVVDWAIGQLKETRDKPWFLAVGLYRPHLPWYVPEKYFEQIPLADVKLPKVLESDLDDVPAAGVKMARPQGDHRKVLEAKQWERGVQGYLASIAFADAQLGRLLDALDKSSQADNTIVVLWGDHGWHLGEKQHWRKFSLWEKATRVPLIISAPGVTKPGSRCERTVSLMDLYPTLVELCGLPRNDRNEGVSLVPLLKDAKSKWNHPALTTHGRGNHAIRSERWRYIRYADGSEELYDHQTDPQEWNNLAGDEKYASVRRGLAGFLPKVEKEDAPARRRANRPARANRAAGSETRR